MEGTQKAMTPVHQNKLFPKMLSSSRCIFHAADNDHHPCDLSKPSQAEEVFTDIARSHKRIDLLVNAAGV